MASFHGGQQMCTAGGGTLGGMRPRPAQAWATGGENQGSSPSLHLYQVVKTWAGPWPPWASVSLSLKQEALPALISC